MSLLVRKGTMVRSKRLQSGRRPGGQPKAYVNAGLTTEDRRLSEGHHECRSGKTSPALSASSSKFLLQTSDTYEDSRADNDFEPVSYGAIFRQLQEASEDSPTTFDFLQRTYYIVCSSLIVTMLLVLLLLLPIAMISVGASYMGDCPVEPNVPLYLLIGGCMGFIKVLLLLWYQQKARRHEKMGDFGDSEDEENTDEVMSRFARFTNQALSIFLFVWFILGNYWVFSLWQPNYEQPLYDPNNWCDRFVYLFALYEIVALHGIVVLFLVLTFILVLYSACKNCCQRRCKNSDVV